MSTQIRKRRSASEGIEDYTVNSEGELIPATTHGSDRNGRFSVFQRLQNELLVSWKFVVFAIVLLLGLSTIIGWDRLTGSIGGTTQKARSSSAHRLVAIGDIHGDLQQAQKALQLMGITDKTGKWIADKTTLVQTGDLVDRGPDSISVVRLFEDLKVQASTSGGQVYTLLGNHELMNLESDLRYVSKKEFAAMGTKNALQLPKLLQEDLKKKRWFSRLSLSNDAEKNGALLWWGGLQKGAWFGDILRNLPTAVITGKGMCRTAFFHGGINMKVFDTIDPASARKGEDFVAELNKRIKELLADCPGAACNSFSKDEALLGMSSTMWYRGFETLPEDKLCPEVDRILAILNVNRIVTGHNLQVKKKVRARCGGKLFLIDVGISRSYLGGMAGWECHGGNIAVHYSATNVDKHST